MEYPPNGGIVFVYLMHFHDGFEVISAAVERFLRQAGSSSPVFVPILVGLTEVFDQRLTHHRPPEEQLSPAASRDG
jgi:hypothetical protein